MLGPSLSYSLITCTKKEFLKYSALQGNTCKVLQCLCQFLIEGSKFEYVMIVLLKEINRAKTIVSSVFFVGGTEVPILDAIYPLIAPVIANVTLYCTDSILFKNYLWGGW